MTKKEELEKELKEIRLKELEEFKDKINELLEAYNVMLVPEFTYINQELNVKIAVKDLAWLQIYLR